MIVLDAIVEKMQPYRAYGRIVDLRTQAKPLLIRYPDQDHWEIGDMREPRILIHLFVEVRSDREIELIMRDYMAARRSCDFSANEKTAGHNYFGRSESAEGQLNIFEVMRVNIKEAG